MDLHDIILIKSYMSNIGLIRFELANVHVLCCRISKREALVRNDDAWNMSLHDIDDINTILIDAADCGRVHILDLFRETMTLSKDNFRIHNNRMIRRAARSGHIDVLKFLYYVVSLSADDFRARNNAAIHWAARFCHLGVLHFLWHEVKLNVHDFRSYDNHAVRCALLHNRLEVLRFLYYVVGLRAADFQRTHFALSRDNPMLEFLRDTVGVQTIRDRYSLYVLLSTIDAFKTKDTN